ncbi:MAG: DUF2922 domain-containing protein [Synergistaceae bacterium]|jgi:hypothetical protein|nr:DUF2922 domain-containing protein [Synergistaceae bacterium]
MGISLRTTFNAGEGKKISFSFPWANPGADASDIKNLMQEMIANGEIYAEAPTGIVSAEFVERTVSPVEMD